MERRSEQRAGIYEDLAKIAVNLCALGGLVNSNNLSLGYLTICENLAA